MRMRMRMRMVSWFDVGGRDGEDFGSRRSILSLNDR